MVFKAFVQSAVGRFTNAHRHVLHAAWWFYYGNKVKKCHLLKPIEPVI